VAGRARCLEALLVQNPETGEANSMNSILSELLPFCVRACVVDRSVRSGNEESLSAGTRRR
jgi:hypothetical protein